MGNPHVRSSCSSTPVESPAPGHLRCGDAAPIDSQSKGFHVEQFRGSIARPSHSLSTLRTADYSNGTQDSLPAAGQLYRTGIAPEGFLRKVSEIRHFFLPPFPRLRGARLTCCCPFGAKNDRTRATGANRERNRGVNRARGENRSQAICVEQQGTGPLGRWAYPA